ncbi:MAG: hypothetical protein NTX63_00530 [Candidatus Peregrinibacteria bacterium]|nr:hypothetical protein [Candidatus Peregrinibacteria bacterium]
MTKRKAITPEEIIYNLTLDEDFQREIRKIRKLLKIPVNGYVKEKIKDFDEFYETVQFGFVMKEACGLVADMLLNNSYAILIFDYLLFNKFEVRDPFDFVGRIIFPPVPDQEDSRIVKYLGEGFGLRFPPYVDIRFFPNITKNDAIAFIEAKFDKIQELFIKQGCEPMKKRINPKTYKERDRLIIELSRMSKKELGDEHAKYKDLLIKKKMLESGYGSVSEGYIRKIISKYGRRKA